LVRISRNALAVELLLPLPKEDRVPLRLLFPLAEMISCLIPTLFQLETCRPTLW
jgi:hypothetical protein